MARPAYSTQLDTMLAAGVCSRAFRVLTCNLAWPAGDPPYATGGVSVPTIPDSPPAYDPATFDPDIWTDVKAMVDGYHYTQDAGMQCDQLSLSVPVAWRGNLATVFRENRAIVIQRMWRGAGQTTTWVNLCFCLSDGYSESWQAPRHMYTVNAKDVLKLANLERLGALTGSVVYQADLVRYGTLTDHAAMALTGIAADAYEYGIPAGPFGVTTGAAEDKLIDSAAAFTAALVGETVTVVKAAGNQTATIDAVDSGTQLTLSDDIATDATHYYIGGIHGNWSDKPGPQLWALSIPNAEEDLRLAIAGDALQAVFGEGVVRLGKTYCETPPGEEPVKAPDFKQGLGLDIDQIPEIEGVVYRFAHPVMQDKDEISLPSDIADSLTQVEDPPTAGRVQVSGDITACPPGMHLVLLDGSGTRYTAARSTALTYDSGNDATTITLTDETATIATGTAMRYGDANRVQDVIYRMLLDCGYQVSDNTAAFYLTPPEAPYVNGVQTDIVLPPMSYLDTDEITALEAIEQLRRDGYIPPSYYVRATAAGQVVTNTVSQLADGNGDIIPVNRPTEAEIDRGDLQVATRVTARGLVRQVQDAAETATLTEPAEADDGLPAINGSHQVTVGGTAYTLHGHHTRPLYSGRNTSVSAGKLVDSRAAFGDDVAGATVTAVTTDGIVTATVTGKDSATTLSLSDDIFTESPISYDIGAALRSFNESGGDYYFGVNHLIQRDVPASTYGRTLRPWGWYYRGPIVEVDGEWTLAGLADMRTLAGAWVGSALLDLEFPSPQYVAAIELNVSNPWEADLRDWGGNRHNADIQDAPITTVILGNTIQVAKASADPQLLTVQYWDDDAGDWYPLVSNIECGVKAPNIIRVDSADFDTRAAVTTSKLRLTCAEPFVAKCGTQNEAYFHVVIAAYLWQLRVWTSGEIRGTAELGVTAPFDSADWQAIRARLRRRTYLLPDAVPWAQTAGDVNWLALEWLKEKARDLAPRKVKAIRPDVKLWDTVSIPLPDGTSANYLVTSCDHTHEAQVSITGVNYAAPYNEV